MESQLSHEKARVLMRGIPPAVDELVDIMGFGDLSDYPGSLAGNRAACMAACASRALAVGRPGAEEETAR